MFSLYIISIQIVLYTIELCCKIFFLILCNLYVNIACVKSFIYPTMTQNEFKSVVYLIKYFFFFFKKNILSLKLVYCVTIN